MEFRIAAGSVRMGADFTTEDTEDTGEERDGVEGFTVES